MGRIGAHVSVAGGPHTAFGRGDAIGAEALQIFVKNTRSWNARPLAPEAIAAFRERHRQAGGPDATPLLAHASYLINLCSPEAGTLAKSRAALADELTRCSQLGVGGLVVHPGAHLGEGAEAGVDAVARSIDAVFAQFPEASARLLLENTAGQGTVLGASPAELGRIVERVDAPERLRVCLDSCHAFAAGYDLREEDEFERLLDDVDAAVGLERVAAWHLNDSKFPPGGKRDRHESIGEGEIGEGFFARLVGDARFTAAPMVVETPRGDDDLGHARDVARLKGLRAD